MSHPRWVATTWAIVVSMLWPWLPVPSRTCTLPLTSMLSTAGSELSTPNAMADGST